MTTAQVRCMRMHSQGLAGPRPGDVAEAVRRAGAIQAQDTHSSRLGIRARTDGLTVADVVRACNDERSVVRIWGMRGTIHVVPSEDARWMVALLGPTLVARHATRRRQLGLDEPTEARAISAMARILADRGPMSRDDLMEGVIASGVPVDTSDQQPAHLVYLAAFRGLVCRGPDPTNGGSTLVRVDDWLPPAAPRATDDALAALALRFVGAYQPVGARDLAYWSALPAGMATRGMNLIADRLEAVSTPFGPGWILAGAPMPEDEPLTLRLLAAFDGALLGHRDRAPLVGDRPFTDITAGSWILPSAMLDGRLVATWRPVRGKGRVAVQVTPLDPLDPPLLPHLHAEAADVGRFLGLTSELEVLPEREPERSARGR